MSNLSTETLAELALDANDHYVHAIDQVAQRLEALAAELRRDYLARPVGFNGRQKSYVSLAVQAQKTLTWGLANAHVEELATKAERADECARDLAVRLTEEEGK